MMMVIAGGHYCCKCVFYIQPFYGKVNLSLGASYPKLQLALQLDKNPQAYDHHKKHLGLINPNYPTTPCLSIM